MKKKFLDDMDMPAAAKTKSAKNAPPWMAGGSDEEESDDILEDGMGDDEAPAEATATEESEPGSTSLADASDDELMAELEKRGLSAGGDAAPEAEDDEEEFT